MKASDPNVVQLLKEWGDRQFGLSVVADDVHGGRNIRLETPLSDAALFGLYNLIAERLGLRMDPDIESGLFDRPDAEQLIRAEGEKIARESFIPYLVPHESLVWAMFFASPDCEDEENADFMLEVWKKRWPEEEES